MDKRINKKAAVQSGRIGLTFLAAAALLVAVAYFVLSGSSKKLLADYILKLVQAMVDQGVTMIEYELSAGRNEARVLADSFSVPDGPGLAVNFPDNSNGQETDFLLLTALVLFWVLSSLKKDAQTFLSVLASEYRGVCFVNLGLDTVRHLYIPPYFEEMLRETDDVFSKALSLYARRIVSPAYSRQFEDFCDFQNVETQLDTAGKMEFVYQNTEGTWLRLQILKFKNYNSQYPETLWIFSNMQN